MLPFSLRDLNSLTKVAAIIFDQNWNERSLEEKQEKYDKDLEKHTKRIFNQNKTNMLKEYEKEENKTKKDKEDRNKCELISFATALCAFANERYFYEYNAHTIKDKCAVSFEDYIT
jgi:hypothetical protein